jgi:hypothetical protein
MEQTRYHQLFHQAIFSAPRPAVLQYILKMDAYLDDANVWLLSCLIDGHLGYPLNPVLNGIGQVRHNLDSLSEVVSSALGTSVSTPP